MERWTEELSMVEADRRYGGYAGRKHVRRIEATAEAGFDDGDINVLPGEPVEGESGRDFEESSPNLLGNPDPALEEFKHFCFGNRLAVDGDSLPEVDEMRRGIPPHLKCLPTKQGLARRDDAAFAVCAGNVDGGEFFMRRPEPGEQLVGTFESWFYSASRAGEERVDRLAVRRQDVVHPAAAGFPVMCRSNCPTVRFNSARATTESTIPCSSRNSAV